MSTKKHTRMYLLRSFTILLLIGLLIPSGSVFAGAPAQAEDITKFAALRPVDGLTDQVPANEQLFEPLVGTNFIRDGSFESSFGNSTYWAQFSTNRGFPTCKSSYCGTGSGTAGPRSGSVWGWFGGVYFGNPGAISPEISYVSQSVAFPACGKATLNFYLRIGYAQSGSSSNDYIAARIDGKTVFSANATQKSTYSSYKLVSVDVSAYANGGVHEVRFFSSTSGQLVNFSLDDISLTQSGKCKISGDTGVAGTTLSYTDGVAKNKTSKADGTYSLPVTYNWSGMVTPSHACYTFDPANRSYTNVISHFTGHDYTPTFVPASGCADVNALVNGALQSRHGLLSNENARTNFTALNGGPAEVVSTNLTNILASQRVIYGGASYTEIMGLPKGMLSEEYWFPWYDNITASSQLRVTNMGNSPTTVNVFLKGLPLDSFDLAAGETAKETYPNNPQLMQIVSTAEPILASLKILYGTKGYAELIGQPVEQLSQEVWYPLYDNVSASSQLRVGNTGATETTITVFFKGTQIDSFPVKPGRTKYRTYVQSGGPLRVVSSAEPIVSSLRVLYGGAVKSYSEMMGMPVEQLSKEFWYPVYDHVHVGSELRIVNTGVLPTIIKVYAKGVEIDSFSLDPDKTRKKTYVQDTGPLHIVSSLEPIVSSVRLLYSTTGFTSHSEMMGMPGEELSNQYFFPWYNNVGMVSELRFAKP